MARRRRERDADRPAAAGGWIGETPPDHALRVRVDVIGSRLLFVALLVAITAGSVAFLVSRPDEEIEARSPSMLEFDGDFDTGDLSQWNQVSCDEDRSPTVGMTPALQGHAARFELRPDDENPSDDTSRCEVATKHSDPLRIDQGEEWWFGFALRFEEITPEGTWRTFSQWKMLEGPPILAISDRYGDGSILLRRHGDDDFVYWRTPMTMKTWHRFVVRIHFHSDPEEGYVELWHAEGSAPLVRQTLNLVGGGTGYRAYNTTHGGTDDGEHSHWRVGLYRDEAHTSTDVMDADEAKYGSSFSFVAPPAP